MCEQADTKGEGESALHPLSSSLPSSYLTARVAIPDMWNVVSFTLTFFFALLQILTERTKGESEIVFSQYPICLS